jgi:hypothetical protein
LRGDRDNNNVTADRDRAELVKAVNKVIKGGKCVVARNSPKSWLLILKEAQTAYLMRRCLAASWK